MPAIILINWLCLGCDTTVPVWSPKMFCNKHQDVLLYCKYHRINIFPALEMRAVISRIQSTILYTALIQASCLLCIINPPPFFLVYFYRPLLTILQRTPPPLLSLCAEVTAAWIWAVLKQALWRALTLRRLKVKNLSLPSWQYQNSGSHCLPPLCQGIENKPCLPLWLGLFWSPFTWFAFVSSFVDGASFVEAYTNRERLTVVGHKNTPLAFIWLLPLHGPV